MSDLTVEQPQATRYTGGVCNMIRRRSREHGAMVWIGQRNPVVGGALSSAILAAMVVAAHLSPALAIAVFARRRSAALPGCLAGRRRAEEALRARE